MVRVDDDDDSLHDMSVDKQEEEDISSLVFPRYCQPCVMSSTLVTVKPVFCHLP